MQECLTSEIVARYAEGRCSAEEFDAVEKHLSECETCRLKIQSGGSFLQEDTATITPDSVSETMSPSAHTEDHAAAKTTRALWCTSDSTSRQVETISAVFENYEVVQELPRGGQAAVYKAIHKPTKTNVAIKVLLPTLLASKRARYYFEREAEVIATLDHPNIVKIRDSGIIQGGYFFAMEYIDGESLDRYVKSKKLSFRDKIKLFRKVCTAVSHAHQQGIIHRDLKFANILVDKRGEPHILDFGLAKAVGLSELDQKDAMPTMPGQWAGSLSNMSPEQAAGQPGLIDTRTDVYALGGILYHLLTGQYPYDVTGSTLQVLQNIQQTEPVRPRSINRKFDSDVEAILLTALAKDKEQRYQSVADLKADIDNWLDGRPIRVRSISTLYVLRKIIARHRYASAVILLLVLIILSFSYVSFDLYLSARKAQRETASISAQWATQGEGLISMAQQAMPMAFTKLLQAWRDGRYGDAQKMALYLPQDSKERKGAVFLFRLTAHGREQADAQNDLGPENEWLADFLRAEYHMKNREPDRALESYLRSQEVLERMPYQQKTDLEKFLESLIKAGLYELTNQSADDFLESNSVSGVNK